jgi:hypothetical protein
MVGDGPIRHLVLQGKKWLDGFLEIEPRIAGVALKLYPGICLITEEEHRKL